ncbi:MAG: hypothetical protein J0I77_12030 [Rudaea sp.]|uniref:hypothetical protein n=1 Tax=unclassified Rudaea TaxID=2627037 RepID=UPI0010F91D73|nr:MULTISPECIES: hypothetical protein [unclassified Rudaea]MBN8886442.1 hypothetical protein [Rudaea sp.]MBR0347389.1 hypothetical protein [Rudaea sp.]
MGASIKRPADIAKQFPCQEGAARRFCGSRRDGATDPCELHVDIGVTVQIARAAIDKAPFIAAFAPIAKLARIWNCFICLPVATGVIANIDEERTWTS